MNIYHLLLNTDKTLGLVDPKEVLSFFKAKNQLVKLCVLQNSHVCTYSLSIFKSFAKDAFIFCKNFMFFFLQCFYHLKLASFFVQKTFQNNAQFFQGSIYFDFLYVLRNYFVFEVRNSKTIYKYRIIFVQMLIM
jgi:hypothetical protein